MITVIQLLCIAAFTVGWVVSGLSLWPGHTEYTRAIAFALFAIASYYAYQLAGASLPKPQP